MPDVCFEGLKLGYQQIRPEKLLSVLVGTLMHLMYLDFT